MDKSVHLGRARPAQPNTHVHLGRARLAQPHTHVHLGRAMRIKARLGQAMLGYTKWGELSGLIGSQMLDGFVQTENTSRVDTIRTQGNVQARHLAF